SRRSTSATAGSRYQADGIVFALDSGSVGSKAGRVVTGLPSPPAGSRLNSTLRHHPRPAMPALPETVLQFGSGRFLRAFFDLFVHHANEQGQNVGRVVVVQSTGEGRA